jgi:hypothetical protein
MLLLLLLHLALLLLLHLALLLLLPCRKFPCRLPDAATAVV